MSENCLASRGYSELAREGRPIFLRNSNVTYNRPLRAGRMLLRNISRKTIGDDKWWQKSRVELQEYLWIIERDLLLNIEKTPRETRERNIYRTVISDGR